MFAEQKINIFLRRGGMRGRRKDFGAAGSAEYMYYMQVSTNLGLTLVSGHFGTRTIGHWILGNLIPGQLDTRQYGTLMEKGHFGNK